ncbi:MAG: polysaccharide biosynthesis/export family protein [Muribaculaceae bacterium]|nr:polysaccharide biosynthesis/export family protein [Muribaculaceae bacterium]
MTNKSIFKHTLLVLFLAVVASSCTTPKNVGYFQGSENAGLYEIAVVENKAIKVEPFDKLSIIVTCKDPALAQMFNLLVFTNSTAQRSGYNGTADIKDYSIGYNDGINGFTVSADGTIDYPILGKIKVEGMTRDEVAAFIKGEIVGRGLIKDPVVTVEFLNIGVSLLGEVNSPGRYDLNADVITITEAISLARDLTIQGNRQNIKVLRKEGNNIRTYVVDITDTKNLLSSPAYYLKQGDVVYVEPNDIRKRQTTANGNSVTNVSFWISVASLLTSAAILFKK